MKRIIILVTVMVMIMLAGCGNDKTEKTERNNNGVEEIKVEEIIVEEIQVEEIQVEDIKIEKIPYDDEYNNEKNYNNKVNTWENVKINSWD